MRQKRHFKQLSHLLHLLAWHQSCKALSHHALGRIPCAYVPSISKCASKSGYLWQNLLRRHRPSPATTFDMLFLPFLSLLQDLDYVQIIVSMRISSVCYTLLVPIWASCLCFPYPSLNSNEQVFPVCPGSVRVLCTRPRRLCQQVRSFSIFSWKLSELLFETFRYSYSDRCRWVLRPQSQVIVHAHYQHQMKVM